MIGQSNFISKDTAEKVRAVIDKKPEEWREESLFYKVRPVRLTSSFTDGAASGEFINASGEAVTGATGITLYNVEGKGGGASGDMIWGIYRGRWEQITEPSGWRCWFINEGAATIAPGEMCGIVGLADVDLSSTEAVEKWQQEGLRLRVKRIGLIYDANAAWLGTGVAVDKIAVNEIGKGVTTDLFCALVYRDPAAIDEAHRFLPRADWKTVSLGTSDGVTRNFRMLSFVKYPGNFTVIDAARGSNASDIWDSEWSRAIATGSFVFSLVKPSAPGPCVSRIDGVNNGVAELTNTVVATSPLKTLSQDDVGKKVLVWRDSDTQQWRIIPELPTGGTQ